MATLSYTGMVNTEMTAEMAKNGFSHERMIAPEDITEALLLVSSILSLLPKIEPYLGGRGCLQI